MDAIRKAAEGKPDAITQLALERSLMTLFSIALKQAIIPAMKQGARFTTSLKEGGTNITWTAGHFTRSDYGDYPDQLIYASEATLHEALRQFYDWETSKNIYPKKVSELQAWKLTLRLLRQ